MGFYHIREKEKDFRANENEIQSIFRYKKFYPGLYYIYTPPDKNFYIIFKLDLVLK